MNRSAPVQPPRHTQGVSAPQSQLLAHHATKTVLSGTHGPIAALYADAGSGDLVVMLPGFTAGKEDFVPLLDPLVEAGFSVLAMDLPGQHESAGPDNELDYRPVALGALVAEVLTHSARDHHRIILLGHSFGGLVARGAVLAGAPVVGLTLLCSGPASLPPGPRRDMMERGADILRERGVEAAWTVRERHATAADPQAWERLPAELKALFKARFVNSNPAGLAGMADGARLEPDLVPQLLLALRRIGAPCLVVCGEADYGWSPAAQRDMAQRLDADFAVISGAAHNPNTENPAALLATLIPTWRTWLS